MWRHAMSDEVWNVVMRCGMMVWCMGNMVVCCDARCEMCLWNTGWCAIAWRHIRHGVMRNDGWNPVLDVWCGLECVLWDSGMCNLYLNVVMCMVWCVVVCGLDVEWCVEMWWSDLMWIVALSVCEMWCNVECCNFRHGVMWNAIEMRRGVDCGVLVCGMLHIMQDVESYDRMWNVELWWWRMWHMQCAVRLLCDDRCGNMMQCGVMSDGVWCKIKMWWWNMVWCEMCCDVECGHGVE